MDASTLLVPPPRIWLRATILAALTALIMMADRISFSCVAFCLTMTALLGTFPRARIGAKTFEKEWFVCFVPVGVTRTRLADVVQIETDLESRMGMVGGCLLGLVFGFMNVLFIWLLDWLIPWAGGDYKLWLRTESDQRVLAWQGNGEVHFRRNLEILKNASGLPVTRG